MHKIGTHRRHPPEIYGDWIRKKQARSESPRSGRSEENIETVSEALAQCQKKSFRGEAVELNISVRSIQQILRHHLRLFRSWHLKITIA